MGRRLPGIRLLVPGSHLWQAMCSVWSRDCLAKDDATKVIQPIEDAIIGNPCSHVSPPPSSRSPRASLASSFRPRRAALLAERLRSRVLAVVGRRSSISSPVAMRMTLTALPMTSAGRFSPLGPRALLVPVVARLARSWAFSRVERNSFLSAFRSLQPQPDTEFAPQVSCCNLCLLRCLWIAAELRIRHVGLQVFPACFAASI